MQHGKQESLDDGPLRAQAHYEFKKKKKKEKKKILHNDSVHSVICYMGTRDSHKFVKLINHSNAALGNFATEKPDKSNSWATGCDLRAKDSAPLLKYRI